ncbi:hypothetical protein PQX77_010681 [Marasmius sp. AFHP31]|nr:hypothetical protein PQX77_010681 [Marasmius sp. AFHP31]
MATAIPTNPTTPPNATPRLDPISGVPLLDEDDPLVPSLPTPDVLNNQSWFSETVFQVFLDAGIANGVSWESGPGEEQGWVEFKSSKKTEEDGVTYKKGRTVEFSVLPSGKERKVIPRS